MWFEKISFEQWYKDLPQIGVDEFTARRWHGDIKLPKQQTVGSAGMDFYIPYDVRIQPHNTCRVATGVRWVCSEAFRDFFCLMIYPRSSMGIKGLRLLNTVGVIDSTYCLSDNEGHIQLFFENMSDEEIVLPAGTRFAQGILTGYAICDGAKADDDETRNGGFGSTDEVKEEE